ncbi:serine protease [Magnetospira sp. QH-2]|uniref:S1 family peptidase n=1 Tax=Magnetospira sp. (strain QH-2) TaxID=1288970 RepID=UPI00130E51EC|nr:serine protease [Magnetospira sp. QH-2]
MNTWRSARGARGAQSNCVKLLLPLVVATVFAGAVWDPANSAPSDLSGWKGGIIRRGADGKIIRDADAFDPLEKLTKGRKKTGIGSGFFITPGGHLLTNHHVINGCKLITVETPSNQAGKAELLDIWEGVDLALLKSTLTPVGVAAFQAEAHPAAGAPLAAVGYPTKTLPPINPKYIPATYGKKLGDRHPWFSMKGEVFPGNSGGPAINEAGHIAGVVVAKVNAPKMKEKTGKLVTDLSFAIRLDAVRQFLGRNKVKVTTADKNSSPLAQKARFAHAKKFVARIGCWK